MENEVEITKAVRAEVAKIFEEKDAQSQAKAVEQKITALEGEKADLTSSVATLTAEKEKLEAERKLEKANENLIRITDILSELEKQVGPLFEQSEKAKKYLALSEEFKKLQIGLWLYDLEKSNDWIVHFFIWFCFIFLFLAWRLFIYSLSYHFSIQACYASCISYSS